MSFQKFFKRSKSHTWLSEESILPADVDEEELEFNHKDGQDEEDNSPENIEVKEKKKKKKRYGFLRSVKNVLLLKRFRSPKRKRMQSDICEETGDSMEELDKNGNEEDLERIMCNGNKIKLDKATKDRIKRGREAREKKRKGKGVRIDSRATQFKKRKTTKKKVIKATKRTGKFIGRGAIYTGSAFQYLAPITSPPPERTWKRWKERSAPAPYRQSEYAFF